MYFGCRLQLSQPMAFLFLLTTSAIAELPLATAQEKRFTEVNDSADSLKLFLEDRLLAPISMARRREMRLDGYPRFTDRFEVSRERFQNERVEDFATIDWIYALVQLAARRYPSTDNSAAYIVNVTDRPTLTTKRFTFDAGLQPGLGTQDLLTRRQDAWHKRLRSEVPNSVLEGCLQALTGNDAWRDDRLVDALFLEISNLLVDESREGAHLPKSTQWRADPKLGSTFSHDRALASRITSFWATRRNSLSKLKPIEFASLEKNVFQLTLATYWPAHPQGGDFEPFFRVIRSAEVDSANLADELVEIVVNILVENRAERSVDQAQLDVRRVLIESQLNCPLESGVSLPRSIDFLKHYLQAFISNHPIEQSDLEGTQYSIRWVDFPKYLHQKPACPVIRPSVKGDVSEEDRRTLVKAIKHFFDRTDRVNKLRGDDHAHSALLLTGFSLLVRDVRDDESKAAELLKAWAGPVLERSERSEALLLLAHLKWLRLFWNQQDWAESVGDVNSSQLNSIRGRRVEALVMLAEQCTLPGAKLSGKAGSHDDLVAYMRRMADNAQAPGESSTWKFCLQIYNTVFAGRLQLVEKAIELEKIKGLELKAENKAIPRETRLSLVVPPSESILSSEQLLAHAGRERHEFLVRKFNHIVGRREPEKLSLRFKVFETRYAKDQLLTDLVQFFSSDAPVEYPKGALAGLEPFSADDDYLFGDALRDLALLCYSRQELSVGEREHMRAGFIFQPEIEAGVVFKNGEIARQLRTARRHYLNAYAASMTFMTGPLAHARFGVDDVLRIQVAEDNEKFVDRFQAMPAERWCRPTSLELLAGNVRNVDNLRWPGPDSLVGVGVFRNVVRARELINRVDSGQDLFAFSGAVQMTSGPEELANRIRMLAGWLDKGLIAQPAKSARLSLFAQRSDYVAESHRQRIHEEAARLAAIDVELVQANLRFEDASLDIGGKDASLIAAHFDTEAQRQFAEGAHAQAVGALLHQNLAEYELFAVKAQIEMLLTALPSYCLHARKAELSVDLAETLLAELENELSVMRQEYLNSKGKSLGDIIKNVLVKVVDVVCTCYGLPPIGSIVDQSFSAIKSASDGDWNSAMRGLGNVASMTGLDNKAEAFVNERLNDLGLDKLSTNLQKSGFLNLIQDVAAETGMDKFAEAKALSLLNQAGKSFLPSDLTDALIPPEKSKWADKITGDDLKSAVLSRAGKAGGDILQELGRVGTLKLLDELGNGTAADNGSKVRELIEQKLGIDRKKHANFDITLKESLADARKGLSQSLKTLLEEVKATDGKQRFDLRTRQRVLAELAGLEIYRTRPKVMIDDNAFDQLMNDLREKSPDDITFWRDSLPQFLKSNAWDATFVALAERSFTLENLEKGVIPTAEEFMGSLTEAIVSGCFALQLTKVGEPNTLKPEDIATLSADLKEVLVGVQSAADLSISVQLSRRFFPKDKGKLVQLLTDWQSELDTLFQGADDRAMAGDIKHYYGMVYDTFKQVDLKLSLKPEEYAQLMNPPEVTLRKEYREKFARIDNTLAESQTIVMQIVYSEDGLRKGMNKIYNAQDENVYRDAVKTLFAPFREKLAEAKQKIAQVRNQDGIGWPNEQVKTYLEKATVIRPWAEKTFKRIATRRRVEILETMLIPERKKAADEAKANADREPANSISKKTLEQVAERLAQQLKQTESEKDTHLASLNSDDQNSGLSAKAIAVLQTSAENELFDLINVNMTLALEIDPMTGFSDRQLLFLPSDFRVADKSEAVQKAVFQQTSAMVQRLQSMDHVKADGLFANALNDLVGQSYVKSIDAFQSSYDAKSKSNKAIAFALQGSAERSRKQAAEIAKKQAIVRKDIAILEKDRLQHFRTAQVARLRSVEFLFQAASVDQELALMDQWEFGARGNDVEQFSSTQIDQINDEIWRAFRDMVFFWEYYELNSDVRKEFTQVLNLDPPPIFPDSRLWKPGAAVACLERLKCHSILTSSRYKRPVPLDNRDSNGETGLKVTPEILRQFYIDRHLRGDVVSLLIDVRPSHSYDPKDTGVSNPTPAPLDPELRLTSSESRRLVAMVPMPGFSCARLHQVCQYGNLKDTGSTFIHIRYRHVGDAFLTRDGKNGPGVVSFTWPQLLKPDWSDQLGPWKGYDVVPYDSSPNNPLSSFSNLLNLVPGDVPNITSEVQAQLRANAYKETIEKELNTSKPDQDRQVYFMYPLCGTYEFLFPKSLLDKDGWYIQIIFVGSGILHRD